MDGIQHERNSICFGIDFLEIESIFDGSTIDFSEIKTIFFENTNFGKYQILKRSDELQKNFYNEKALEIYQLLPCNWTRPKDEQPFIKHGLMYVFIVLLPVCIQNLSSVYTCLLQDDPLSKTGYVGGNGTNISAGGSTDQRKVGPTTTALGKNVRKRSGKTTNASEEESDQDGGGGGEFQ